MSDTSLNPFVGFFLLFIMLVGGGFLLYWILLPYIGTIDVGLTGEEVSEGFSWEKYNPVVWFPKWIEQRKAMAEGKIIQGNVDQTQFTGVRPQGLKFDKKSPLEFDDSDLTVFWVLEGSTYTGNPIEVRLDARSQLGSVATSISPDSTASIYGRQSANVKFNFENLKPGGHVITATGDFDHSTFSSLRQLLTREETLLDLLKNNEDFFQRYAQGFDGRMESTSKRGPATLAISFRAQPVGIRTTDSNKRYDLQMTVHNHWPGKINSIKEIYLFTPAGFRLVDTNALSKGATFSTVSCEEVNSAQAECDEHVVVWKIPVNSKEITNLQPYYASFVVDSPAIVLGTDDYVNRRFEAVMNYVYQFEKKKSVRVKEPVVS